MTKTLSAELSGDSLSSAIGGESLVLLADGLGDKVGGSVDGLSSREGALVILTSIGADVSILKEGLVVTTTDSEADEDII